MSGRLVWLLLGAVLFRALAGTVWAAEPPFPFAVTPLDAETRRAYRFSDFYHKSVSAHGFLIVSSDRVSDFALLEAAYLIDRMIGHRRDLLEAMAADRIRFVVMAYNEFTVDIPEHSHLTPAEFWNRRARGLGASHPFSAVSCGEENLLGFRGDPYSTENILIHEFAHTLDGVLRRATPDFYNRLMALYRNAQETGLFKNTYAMTSPEEYWAEGTQGWFDTNRENDPYHNHVNTREELKAYDPGLAALLADIFGDGPWRYQHPRQRGFKGHLEGFNPATAPVFRWPEAPTPAAASPE